MRVTFDPMECVALIEAVLLQQEALHLHIRNARKLNKLDELGPIAAEYADLISAEKKLRSALAGETKTHTSPTADEVS